MDKKLKNAIRESFVFPESKHKKEFFAQVGASYAAKRKKRFPVASRLVAAAAALLIGIGIYGASKLRTDFDGNDTEHTTQPTTAGISVTEDTTAQSAQTSTETAVTAVSSTAAEKSATTAKTQTTTAVKTNPNRTAKATGQARTTVKPPTATEAVTTTTIYEEVEGSVTMKKMIAFLSAMGIAATANPTGVYAANETRLEHIFREMYYYSLWKVNHWYYDVNDDGEFDVKDIFEIELYAEHDEECREKYGWFAKDFKNYKEIFELYDEEALMNIYAGLDLNPDERENRREKKVEDKSQLVRHLDVEIDAKNVARYYLYLNGEYPTNDEIREILRDYDFLTVEGPDHVERFIEFMEELRNETIDEAYTEEQLEVFRHLDSDDVEKDLNGDGEFNFYDSYDLLYYIAYAQDVANGVKSEDILPAEVSERIKQYGDIDLNGKIDEDDLLNLMLYLDKIGVRPLSYFRYCAEERLMRVNSPNVDGMIKKYITGENALGDVDNSGKVNAIDASLVLEHYSKVSTGQSTSFTETQKNSADVNKDGRINAVDASQILSYYAYTATANGDVMTLEEYLQQ